MRSSWARRPRTSRPARWRSRQPDRPAAGLEPRERLLPRQVRPAVADAAGARLVGGGVDGAEPALVGCAVERRLEEGVLEPLAVVLEPLEHAALALLAADRLRVLGPLDLALVVGGGRRVDEPRLAARAEVGGDVGAR